MQDKKRVGTNFIDKERIALIGPPSAMSVKKGLGFIHDSLWLVRYAVLF